MRLLDIEDLKERGIKFSRAHIWRLVKGKKFPRPVKIGECRNGWVESEIDEFIAAKIAERDAA